MNAKAWFVTGTDTDVGKTWATIALMRSLQQQGGAVNAFKPVAAGCVEQSGLQVNADALLIQRFASGNLPYAVINPYAFPRIASPHIACEGKRLDPVLIRQSFEALSLQSDYVLVEGAGGWYSPVDSDWLNADLAKMLNLPILLVVGVRLGCINHALLTAQAIQQSGLKCQAWVAVVIDPQMTAIQSNLEYLRQRLGMPCLGVLPYLAEADFEWLSKMISVDMLKI